MVDVFTKERRSFIMSRIRSKGTGIEREFAETHPSAFPHPDYLPFKPDFVLRKVPIFLDSSFWHGYISRCRFDGMSHFWQTKLFNNILRDICRDSFYGSAHIIEVS